MLNIKGLTTQQVNSIILEHLTDCHIAIATNDKPMITALKEYYRKNYDVIANVLMRAGVNHPLA